MKELLASEEVELEKNLVWIFADRRSGTTWIKELLSYNTFSIDEPLIGLHLGRSTEGKNSFARTLDVQKDRDDYFFCHNYKNIWKFFLRKLILNRIYNQFNKLSTPIIIKEPTGSMAADLISECLTNSKIIILLRDGRDVIDSKVDENALGGWELEKKKNLRRDLLGENRINYIKRHSKFWKTLIEILLKTYENHPKKLRYMLKYEDLKNDTELELQKIYQFLGIDISQESLSNIIKKHSFEKIPKKDKGQGKFRRFASPGMWKENFNKQEKAIMNEIMKDTLTKLGY